MIKLMICIGFKQLHFTVKATFQLSTLNAFIIYDIFLESVKDTVWLLFFAYKIIYYCKRKTAEVGFTTASAINCLMLNALIIYAIFL